MNAEPIEFALFARVIANVCPAWIVLFPKRPEFIVDPARSPSPSEKVFVELFAVLEER